MLPEGSLAESLRSLAVQSGTGILFPPEIVRGLKNRRISGSMGVESALRRLLAGTGLAYRQLNAGTFVIYRAKPRPAPPRRPVDTHSRAEEIIVTDGRRNGTIKRAGDTPTGVVTELDVKRLPTLSISDALIRLPGVRRNDTQSGENRYVSIRGMNNAAASQSIDGVLLTNYVARSRATSTEVIPAALFKSTVVTTAATPDLDENSNAAHVTLSTISGLDGAGEHLLEARLFAGINSRSGGILDTRQPLRASATWRGRLDEEGRIGLALGAGTDRLGSRQDALSVAGYRDIAGNLVPDGRLTRGQTYTRTQRVYAMARLDFQPNDRLALFAEYFYFSHNYTTDQITSAVTVSASNATNVTDHGGNFPVSGSAVYGFNHLSSPRIRDHIVQVGADYALGDDDSLSVRLGATLNHVRQSGLSTGGFVAQGNTLGAPLAYAFSGSDLDLPAGSASLQPDPASYLLGGKATVLDLDSRDRNYLARIDYAHNAVDQDTGFGVKLGSQLKTLRRHDMQNGYARILPPGQSINLSEVTQASSVISLRPVDVDKARLLALLDARGAPSPDPNGVYEADPADEHGQDFRGTERVVNLYGIATYGFERGRISAGLRAAYTRRTLSDVEPDAAGMWGPMHYRQSYWHFLPAIYGDWDASERLKLRASFSSTLERPPINGTARRLVTSYDTPVTRSVSYSSPYLKPTRSDNLEATAEYYYGPYDAYLSFGVFGKRLSDIPATSTTQTIGPDGVRDIVTYTTNVDEVNGRKVYGRMRGVELAWVDPSLSFFPRRLGTLGVMLSYAYIDYKLTAIDGGNGVAASDTRLVFAAPTNYFNAVLYYNKGPFSANLFAQKQSSTPILSYDPRNDRRTSYGVLVDLQASYAFSPNVRGMIEVRNLFDQNIVDRYGVTDYGPAYQTRNNGRTVWIGAQIALF